MVATSNIIDALESTCEVYKGNLYGCLKDVLIVDDEVSKNTFEKIKKEAFKRGLKVFYESQLKYYNGVYYEVNSEFYLVTNGGVYFETDIINKKYDINDIINTFQNNIKRALPVKFYNLLKSDFDKLNYKLSNKCYVKGLYSGLLDSPLDILRKYQNNNYKVIFILNYQTPFKTNFQVLLNKI